MKSHFPNASQLATLHGKKFRKAVLLKITEMAEVNQMKISRVFDITWTITPAVLVHYLVPSNEAWNC